MFPGKIAPVPPTGSPRSPSSHRDNPSAGEGWVRKAHHRPLMCPTLRLEGAAGDRDEEARRYAMNGTYCSAITTGRQGRGARARAVSPKGASARRRGRSAYSSGRSLSSGDPVFRGRERRKIVLGSPPPSPPET
jgi:hypothetical protein